MAFVLVAASGMVSAYASGSSGTKKAKVQTITEGVCIGCRRYDKGRSKKSS